MNKSFAESLRQYPETTPRKVVISQAIVHNIERAIKEKTSNLSKQRIYAFDGYLGHRPPASDYQLEWDLTLENKYDVEKIKKSLWHGTIVARDYTYVLDKEDAFAYVASVSAVLTDLGFTDYICEVEKYTLYIYSTTIGFWGNKKLVIDSETPGYAIHISIKW